MIESMPLKREGEPFPIVSMDINDVWQDCKERFDLSIKEEGNPAVPRGYAYITAGIVLTCYMRLNASNKLEHYHKVFVDPWVCAK